MKWVCVCVHVCVIQVHVMLAVCGPCLPVQATFEDLLNGPLEKKPKLQQEAPSTESLSQLIVQAVHSKDSKLLEVGGVFGSCDLLQGHVTVSYVSELMQSCDFVGGVVCVAGLSKA